MPLEAERRADAHRAAVSAIDAELRVLATDLERARVDGDVRALATLELQIDQLGVAKAAHYRTVREVRP